MYQRERLVRFLGRMPENKRQARHWKIYLRALRQEVLAEPEGDDDG
jgi:hypothetical protein